MKKSLFAIAALAVAGLSFMGCDEILNDACNGTCTSDQLCVETVNKGAACYAEDLVKVDADECDNGRQLNTDGTITCAEAQSCGDKTCEIGKYCADSYNAGKVCVAEVPPCTEGVLQYDEEDNAVYCVSAEVRSCTDDAGCEDGYICDDTKKVCVEGTRDELGEYKFVRIDDLTDVNEACCNDKDGCNTNSDGKTICSNEDPGADIDTIALKKASTGTTSYAKRVVEYKNNFEGGTFYKEDNKLAIDPQKAIGEPDSLIEYANGLPNKAICYYVNKEITNGKYGADDYTFASLGGQGGYIIVEMAEKIENGDTVDVIELGDCDMKSSKHESLTPKKEDVKVQVSVNGKDGWKTIKDSGHATNGLISISVAGL